MTASDATIIGLPQVRVRVLAFSGHGERDLPDLWHPTLAVDPPAILNHQLGLVLPAVVASVAHGLM